MQNQNDKPTSHSSMQCSNCKNIISSDYNFCPICGVHVKPAGDNSTHSLPFKGAEQRQISLLRLDLDKDDKAISEKAVAIITQMGGQIYFVSASSLTAFFGYPIAQDKDAHQAVYTGLRLVQELDLSKAKLIVHTGMIIAEGAKLHGPAIDDLEKAIHQSGMGIFMATQATAKLLSHAFELEKMDPKTNLAKILSVKFDIGVGSQLAKTPLIGRDIELKRLHEYWDKAKGGKSKIILVTGEPGIGKTRLIDAFKGEIASDNMVWMRGYCSAHHQNSAFQALREMWFRYNNVNPNVNEKDLVKIIEDKIKGTDIKFNDIAPLLLGNVGKETAANQKYQTRDEIAKVYFDWMHAASIDKPLVFVLEDLHYVDPSTAEVLEYMVANIGTERLLLVFTFRPEYTCPWANHKSVSTINLNRLSPNETKKIIAHMSGAKTLPSAVVDHVVDKTDGVPLFIEELITSIQESDLLSDEGNHYALKKPLGNFEIPSSLRDLLMARLDKLGEAKKLAQLCAVFGRSCTHNYLRIASGYDEAKLNQLLDQLITAGVLSKRISHDDIIYLYRHMLLQEAAYESLVKVERQNYHVEIADMFVKYFPVLVTQQPEVIAEHYNQGGFIDQAAEYYLLAGERALQRSANSEAIHHLTKGLDLIGRLPPGEGRDRRELPLRAALCIPLMVEKGWGSDAVLNELQRSYELCQRLGDTAHLIPILRGLQSFYVIRGPLNKSHAYGEQLLALARQLQDQSLMLESYRALGHCMYFEGDIANAKKNLEKALQLYDANLHSGHAFKFGIGTDPKVTGLSVLAWISAVIGMPELALQQSREVLAFAEKLGHPFSLTYAYGFTTALYQNMRDYENAEKYARLTFETATERKYVYWQSWGKIFLAWIQAMKLKDRVTKEEYREAVYKGVQTVREGIEEYRAVGSEQGVPFALAMLAQLYIELGEYDQAISLTKEALRHAETYNIHIYDPGLLRIEADALAMTKNKANAAEIERLYRKTIEIASSAGLKTTQMRSTISLYEYLKTLGREKEVLPEMKALYDSFTEGFTILPDLIQAHKILRG